MLSSLDGYNWKDEIQSKKFCDHRWNFSKWLASIFEPNPILLLEYSMSLVRWLAPYCRDETKRLIWYTQTLIRVSIVKGIHCSTLLFAIGLLTFYSQWQPGPGSCNFLMNLSLWRIYFGLRQGSGHSCIKLLNTCHAHTFFQVLSID